MKTFTQVQFVGFNRDGRQLSRTIRAIKARDAYSAGDAIKAMFPAYGFNVVLKFGNPTKISAQVARIARNAGPEEC